MNLKVDVHEGNSDVERQQEYMKEWKIKEDVRKDLDNFLKDLGSGKVNLGKQVSRRTQVKYISLLRLPLVTINKSLKQITKKDLEDFDKAISTDKLKSYRKKAFSQNTKKDIRIALKVLLRWKIGEEKANSMTSFFDIRDIKKTPDYLKEHEIEKLYKSVTTTRERYLIAVLFDGGARAEEFLNIRYEDVELPTKDKNFVKITLKEEYSKTNGRVISLYWKNSLEAVSEYLREKQQEGIKSQDRVYDNTYNGMRIFLRRLGRRALNKDINPHLFRHSSATHYANKLNRQELCYRYGWAFSSSMPDTYISRSGMLNKEVDEKFEGTELSEIKTLLNKEKFERGKMQEDFGNKEKEYAGMFAHLTKELEILKAK